MGFAETGYRPEKRTGMTYKGKEILLVKTRGRPLSGIEKKAHWFPDAKRTEVATLYAFTGDIGKVAELSGVPKQTIRGWIHTTWFKAILEEIRQENNEKLDAIQTEIVHKAQELILDRLENGDVVLTKTGEQVRKPVAVRDLALVSAITIDKRQIIRNKPTTISGQAESETDKLEKLKDFFTTLVNKGPKEKEKPSEPIDVEFSEVIDAQSTGENAPEDSNPKETEGKAA